MLSIIASGLLFLVSILYLSAGLKAPVGKFIWGGQYDGVLPKKERTSSLLSIPAQWFAIYTLLVVSGTITVENLSILFVTFAYIFMVYFLLNTIMNLMSKSIYEKVIMTPVALIITVAFFEALLF
jgi:hypothetical protein